MVARIRLFDESASGVRGPAVVLELQGEHITVAQLIRRRVECRVASTDPTLDPEEQVQVALHAFRRNGFFVLVDDVQLESLEDRVRLDADVDVCFLKLTPLVGG